MKYMRFLILIVLNVSLLSLNAQVHQIIIEPEMMYQCIDNFAASDAWSSNFVGKYWGNKQKEQIAEWLFSQEVDASGNPKGIGLSLWRVNLGGGTLEQNDPDIQPYQRRAESFLTVDGRNYDWGKCQGQQYFMQRAVEHGCNNFLLFSNTPPVHYTKNGRGWSSSSKDANLRPECYDLFAQYLVDVADYYLSKGWNISYISPLNEPTADWVTPRQEGSPWRISEMYKMYTALERAMASDTKMDNIKILVGETGGLKPLYDCYDFVWEQFDKNEDAPGWLVKHFFDEQSPFCLGNLRHVPKMIGGHDYLSEKTHTGLLDTRMKVKDICSNYQISFHQTEWCLLPYDNNPVMDGFTSDWDKGNYANMQAALLMGRLIYADMTVANAEAWGYWKGMELKGDHSLIALYPYEGNIHNGGSVVANKMLWALGNYSFFIRPGYKRIFVDGADDLENLVASAYIDPLQSCIVLVFVNTSFDKQKIDIHIPEVYQKKLQNIAVYRTDDRTDLACIQSFKHIPNDYEIIPRSLTTIVFKFEK